MFSDDNFFVFVTSTLFCLQKALVFEIEANEAQSRLFFFNFFSFLLKFYVCNFI